MRLETQAHGRANIARNSAVAVGVAGLGSVKSATAIRTYAINDSMWDSDHTEFRDTIAIVGTPQWFLPIGVATFQCAVSGQFTQPLSGDNSVGSAAADAEFTAQAFTGPNRDSDNWSFPSLAAGVVTPVARILIVNVTFCIGAPIFINSRLNTRSRVKSSDAIPGDLAARLELATVLQPIAVSGVSDPVAITLTDSGTKYYTQSEAGARDVPLRSTFLSLSHS